jgi:hypothetical protein
MIGEYSCPYLLNSGVICGNSCMRSEGCRLHNKSKKRVPCSDCGKPTGSISGRCPLHIRGFYVSQYYHKKIQRECNRNRAIQIIQAKFREWLYRPGGPMMKKFEKHFNELSITHTKNN